MASISYKNVLPLNVQDYYSPGSQVDWNVKIGDNCRALRNSFKISGQFIPYKVGAKANDNNLDGTLDVRMDASVGLHTVCSMFITSVNGSQKEAISYYPRLIAHRSVAEDSTDAMQANIKYTSEGMSADQKMASKILLGTTSTEAIADLSSAALRYTPFCITPKICLNNAVNENGQNVDLNSSACAGGINITLRLSLNNEVFYGSNATSVAYVLKNIELSWTEIDGEIAVPGGVLLRCSEYISGNINSGTTTISHNLANPASSFSLSFIANSHNSDPKFNRNALEVLPGISRLETMIQDRNLQYKYIQQNQNEIVWNALYSLDNYDGKSRLNVDDYLHQNMNSYGGILGLKFGALLPANTRVGLNIVSTVTNVGDYTGPYLFYMYLSTFQKL
jgi:hypothetical protein